MESFSTKNNQFLRLLSPICTSVPLWEEYNKVRRKSQVVGVVGAWENVEGIKQDEKENRDRFNGSPRLCPPLDKERKKKEKILRKPLTLPLQRWLCRKPIENKLI